MSRHGHSHDDDRRQLFGSNINENTDIEAGLTTKAKKGASHGNSAERSPMNSGTSTPAHCHEESLEQIDTSGVSRRKLLVACVLCLAFMTAEIAGGLLSSSLAIMTDALHLLTDLVGFGISVAALTLARRPATRKMTFGWYRAEVLGALISVLLVWAITAILFFMAVERIINDNYEIDAQIMLITSSLGVAINLVMGIQLQHGGHGHSHGLPGSGHGHSHGGGGAAKKKSKGDGHGHGHGHGHSHQVSKRRSSASSSDEVNGRPHSGSANGYGSVDKNDVKITHHAEHLHHHRHSDDGEVAAEIVRSIGTLGVMPSIEVTSPPGGLPRDDSLIALSPTPTAGKTDSGDDALLSNSSKQHGHGHSHEGGQGHGHSHEAGQGHGHSHDGGHGHSHEGGHGHSHGDGDSHSHDGDDEHGSSDEEGEEGEQQLDMNVRAAVIHVLGDLGQSIGVMIAALIIYFEPAYKIADPICTFIFSVVVLFTTITIMRDVFHILMEGAPSNVEYEKIKGDLLSIRGVKSVHNLRIWALTVSKVAASAHIGFETPGDVTPGDNTSYDDVLSRARQILQKKYGIADLTLQVEQHTEAMDNCNKCLPPPDIAKK